MVSASAQSPDYSVQLRDIDNSLTLLNNTLLNIHNPLGPYVSEADFDYQQDILLDYLVGPEDSNTGLRINATSNRNILAILQQISANVKRSSDDLAANPWWATNSAFALTFPQYSLAYPSEYPNTSTSYSFPQFLSRWSAMLTIPGANGYQVPISQLRSNWWGYFGSLNRSADAGNSFPYTWFDWVSDMMRSNAVVRDHLSAYASETEAQESLSTLDTETAEEFATNAPPAVDEFQIEMPPGLSGFESVSDPFWSFIEDLQPSLSGGDSEITVLPAFSVGGISTTAYKFDFNNSIVPYCRAVMSFLWAVMAGAMVFRLLSGEWAYYCSLGRTTH